MAIVFLEKKTQHKKNHVQPVWKSKHLNAFSIHSFKIYLMLWYIKEAIWNGIEMTANLN